MARAVRRTLLFGHLERLAALRLYDVDTVRQSRGVDGALVVSHLAAFEVEDFAAVLFEILGDGLDSGVDGFEIETLDVGRHVTALEVLGREDKVVLLKLSLGLLAESESEGLATLKLDNDACFNAVCPCAEDAGKSGKKGKKILLHDD